MKKRILALTMIMTLASAVIGGCGQKKNSVHEDISITEQTADNTEEEGDSESGTYIFLGDISKEDFVEKLKKVEINENSLLIGADVDYDENVIEQLNCLLEEQGYDFNVVFCRIPDQCCLDGELVDFAKYLKEQEVNMDILPVWNSDLKVMAASGLLTDITPELEEEKSLKEAYPEKFWELTAVDQKNYGPGLYYAAPDGWAVNQELMQKYGLTEEDLSRDITELEEVLRTVAQGEADPDFAAFLYNPRMFLETIPFFYVDISLPVGYWIDDGAGMTQVVNLFDTDRMLELVGTMNHYYEEGYAKIGDDMISGQSFFMQPDYNGFPIRRTDSLDTWTNLAGVVLLRVPYYQHTEDQLMFKISAIPSWTEHRDDAWDFLTFVNENQEASALLLYGVEGDSYSVSGDGIVAGEKLTEESVFNRCLGNLLITPALSPYEDSGKEELRAEELDSLIPGSLNGFVFDESPVGEEAEAVRELYMEISYFREMFAFVQEDGCADWKEYYEKYNQQLKDAGIDRIVEEMNRQIQEYLGNENQN